MDNLKAHYTLSAITMELWQTLPGHGKTSLDEVETGDYVLVTRNGWTPHALHRVVATAKTTINVSGHTFQRSSGRARKRTDSRRYAQPMLHANAMGGERNGRTWFDETFEYIRRTRCDDLLDAARYATSEIQELVRRLDDRLHTAEELGWLREVDAALATARTHLRRLAGEPETPPGSPET